MDISKKVKMKIEELIELGEIESAKKLLKEYYKIGKDDFEYYSYKGIINILEADFESAIYEFKTGLLYNDSSFDLNYNLAFSYENLHEYSKAHWHYNRCLEVETTEEVKVEILNKLNNLQNNNEIDYKNYDKKIVFFVKKSMDSFLGDIIDDISSDYNILKIIVTEFSQINLGMKWADICWFEWCDELVIYGSKLDIANQTKIICRLHSYEAFTDYISQVNWDSIDKVIFVAEHIRNNVLNKINLDLSKTEVIYNGIDTNKYKFIERTSGFNIAYVGYINYKKGPMLLLHTFKAIYDQDKRYKLHIAGSFQDERYSLYFEEKIKDMGLENNVICYGWQDDIASWLEDKNYIICTSVLEGNPVGLMEAMSRGIKPLIHSFVGAKELYPKKFIWDTIEDAIKIISGDDYDSKEYRNYIESNFTIELQSQKIRKLIDNILEKNKTINESDIRGLDTSEIYSYISNKKFSSGLKVYVANNNKKSLDRMSYLEQICKNMKVIHLGCADHLELIDSKRDNNLWLHDKLTAVSRSCIGFDINKKAVDYINKDLGISNVFYEDITEERSNKIIDSKWDIMIIGEILEHVSNPVEFLRKLKNMYEGYIEKFVITIPNALRLENYFFSQEGYELINSDHKYWFTPYTICKIVHEADLVVEEICMTTGFKVEDNDIKDILIKNNILMDTILIIVKL